MNKISSSLNRRNREIDLLFILMRQYFIQIVLSNFTYKPSLAQKYSAGNLVRS